MRVYRYVCICVIHSRSSAHAPMHAVLERVQLLEASYYTPVHLHTS